MNAFSKLIRYIRINYSKLHLFASKIPFYSVTLFSRLPQNINNVLNISFPPEYSADLVASSHIVVLKCTGRSVFIRDISSALVSDEFSSAEKLELHGFGWISLLNLNMDRQWRLLIRSHIGFWIWNFHNFTDVAWEIPVISERLYNWIIQYNFISKTLDKNFNAALIKSLLKQLKFLRRLLYLPLDFSDKVILIRALAVALSAINDKRNLLKVVHELAIFLKEADCTRSCKTPQEILNVLRYLIEIQSTILFYRQKIPNEIIETVSKLANITRKIRHADGGISIFQSEFTPSPLYVDAVLSCVKTETIADINDLNYLKLKSFEGTIFVDVGNKFFPIEFSAGSQRMILGTYLYFSDQKLSFSKNSKIRHTVDKEKNNIWFIGKSQFTINDHEIMFEKRLYINNLGVDIRCEESLSTKSFDIVHYIVLPGEIDISLLEYQNGFFMDLKSGIRWVWSFNKEAKFSFDFEKIGILNGEKRNFTLLAIDSNSSNRLKWSLKKI
ncbi:MAG: hypothetical protein LBQ08_03075 [Holosporaceae bacterium]|jgi:hypothetical protein|nr:hypothetical protein [Holosporaceae bacterium]